MGYKKIPACVELVLTFRYLHVLHTICKGRVIVQIEATMILN